MDAALTAPGRYCSCSAGSKVPAVGSAPTRRRGLTCSLTPSHIMKSNPFAQLLLHLQSNSSRNGSRKRLTWWCQSQVGCMSRLREKRSRHWPAKTPAPLHGDSSLRLCQGWIAVRLHASTALDRQDIHRECSTFSIPSRCDCEHINTVQQLANAVGLKVVRIKVQLLLDKLAHSGTALRRAV